VRLVVTALAASAVLGASCLLHGSDADSGTAAPSTASPPAAAAPAGHPEPVEGRVEVFDLAIDEPHNFFAADRLVHNKAR